MREENEAQFTNIHSQTTSTHPGSDQCPRRPELRVQPTVHVSGEEKEVENGGEEGRGRRRWMYGTRGERRGVLEDGGRNLRQK